MINLRTVLALVLACSAALMLTGCLQLNSETQIDKHGGGSASMTISMSTAVSEALVEMQELDPEGGPGGEIPSFEDMNKEEIQERVKDFGVKITKFEKNTVDGRETVAIAYDFKDMKGLSAAMGAIMASPSGGGENGLGIFDAGDGNLVLRPTAYEFPAWEEEEEEDLTEESPSAAEMDPAQMQKQMEVMGKLMASLAELSVNLKITVPGDIVTTNAPLQEGRTSIWTIDSSNMMTASENMEPEIVFSGKGLKIKPISE